MKIRKGMNIWSIGQFIRIKFNDCSPVYKYFIDRIEDNIITTPYGVLKVLQHDLCLISKRKEHYPFEEELIMLWEYITDEKTMRR